MSGLFAATSWSDDAPANAFGAGMGGMMGGPGGGMRGFLDVEDDLKLGTKSDTEKPVTTAPKPSHPEAPSGPAMAVKPTAPITLEIKNGQSSAEAWDAYFARHKGEGVEAMLEMDG
ncbi:MAG: hypothetical protein ACYC3X_20295 [Pirellulaceae bacterium]